MSPAPSKEEEGAKWRGRVGPREGRGSGRGWVRRGERGRGGYGDGRSAGWYVFV